MIAVPRRPAAPGTRAELVASWRSLLTDTPLLSARFRDRYAVVLAHLEVTATAGRVDAARSIATTDPHHAGRILAGNAPDAASGGMDTAASLVVDGTGAVAERMRRLLALVPDLETFMAAQPPLVQTNVPIHPSRKARLVRAAAGADQAMVGLVWTAESVQTRRANEGAMARVLDRVAPVGRLRFALQDDYALVQSGQGRDPWVFAANHGPTLEDMLRGGDLDSPRRREILAALRRLRGAMLACGLIWQGYAPRNMFLGDGVITLIDFEEVADASADPFRASELLLWHRVFFADSLVPDEADELFSIDADFGHKVPPDHRMPADSFERSLLGVEKVTWRERQELLGHSIRIEGRHARPERVRDGGILFGHELGHFWGDFLPVGSETRLFRHLAAIRDRNTLVACLETFEAAMEADICRTIRADCAGEPNPLVSRSGALIGVLDAAGSEKLAAARHEWDGWYQELASDPARLIDELLFALGTTVDEIDRALLDAYLVGGADSRKAHEEHIADAVRVGMDFLHGAEPERPFLRYADADQMRASVALPLPVEATGFDQLLADVDQVIAQYAIGQAHPRYLAFPDSGNAVAALAGTLLGPLLNQNLIAVDRSAPSATFVEIQVVEWLRELVGYSAAPLNQLRGVKDVAGLWTTGGHLSNHVAMLVALGQAFPEARRRGLRALDTQPAVVMAGPIAHYSHSDAAFHLGLGWDSVLTVEAQDGYVTDPRAVEQVLANPPSGQTPFMVVGVAGNCRTTGLDDLQELGRICRRHGVWFHVDACHGGSLVFNDRLRAQHLAGIEHSDSVSLDPHKGLFTPYPSSYVVFRDRGVLNHFSRHETAVLADDCWDLGLITPFLGSRGFQSLATWMLLRHVGTRRLGAIVEARQALVRYLERRLDEAGLFVRLNEVDFYRLAFVLCPPEAHAAVAGLPQEDRARAAKTISDYTSRLNTSLYRAGEVCFDEHTLADLANRVGAGHGAKYTIMAACPGNPLLTRADLDTAIDRLVTAARPLAGPLIAELRGGLTWTETEPRLAGPAGWGDVT